MNRKKSQPITVIAALAVLMLVVVLPLLLPRPALAADWDVGIKHLITTRMVYEGGAGKAGETTNTFTVGEEALILCQYEYVKVGDKTKFKPWNVTIYVDNILVKTVSVPSYEEPHAALWAIYKTKLSGQHTVACFLGMIAGTTANDSDTISITMKPGPPLAAAEIPTPLPQKLSEKIALTPNLDLWMTADTPKTPVRGEEDFISYSISSPYEQKWHAEIVRMSGAGERSAATSTVGTLLEGKVSSLSFAGFGFTRGWLDAHGAGVGHYAVRVYFSETANGVTTKGRAAVVRFDLVEPFKAGSVAATQPVVPTVKPKAEPPPMAVAKPGDPITPPKPKEPSLSIGGGFAPSVAKPATDSFAVPAGQAKVKTADSAAVKPKVEPPPAAVAKSSADIIAAAIKPNLSVTGAQAKIEANCQPPQPAMTVTVTIKNNGGALPANKGSVFVKETGGANLSSAGIREGIPLPAIGAGQTQSVDIPAITLQPYSSLAGVHQVQVILNPQQSEGGQLSFNQPAARPYVFPVTFPPGHCKPAQRQAPGASGGQPGSPSTQLPAVQMSPGPPTQPQQR